MSNICRYFDECMLREFEENPYSCDSRGNVRYEMWDCGKPTGMQYDGTCDMYQPMPDVNALSALADRMEKMAGKGACLTPGGLEAAASSIREALGVGK